MPDEINCALLLAAGSGARMQGAVADKILAPIHGQPLFNYSLRAFASCRALHIICIVYRDLAQRTALAAAIADDAITQEVRWVRGGQQRQHSVRNGLAALPAAATHTLIHDCARPCITADIIQTLLEAVRRDGAACLAHPVTDTIKRIPTAGQLTRTPLEDLERDRLCAMETPQGFRHPDILAAYRKITSVVRPITDDCAAAAHSGIHPTLLHNPHPNPKITTATDLSYITWLLSPRPQQQA